MVKNWNNVLYSYLGQHIFIRNLYNKDEYKNQGRMERIWLRIGSCVQNTKPQSVDGNTSL